MFCGCGFGGSGRVARAFPPLHGRRGMRRSSRCDARSRINAARHQLPSNRATTDPPLIAPRRRRRHHRRRRRRANPPHFFPGAASPHTALQAAHERSQSGGGGKPNCQSARPRAHLTRLGAAISRSTSKWSPAAWPFIRRAWKRLQPTRGLGCATTNCANWLACSVGRRRLARARRRPPPRACAERHGRLEWATLRLGPELVLRLRLRRGGACGAAHDDESARGRPRGAGGLGARPATSKSSERCGARARR